MVARTRSKEFNGISSPKSILLSGCSACAFWARASRLPVEQPSTVVLNGCRGKTGVRQNPLFRMSKPMRLAAFQPACRRRPFCRGPAQNRRAAQDGLWKDLWVPGVSLHETRLQRFPNWCKPKPSLWRVIFPPGSPAIGLRRWGGRKCHLPLHRRGHVNSGTALAAPPQVVHWARRYFCWRSSRTTGCDS